MPNISFGQIRYNDATGNFEARVDVHRGDHVFRYPCQMSAPREMDVEQVRFGLACQALRMSDTPKHH